MAFKLPEGHAVAKAHVKVLHCFFKRHLGTITAFGWYMINVLRHNFYEYLTKALYIAVKDVRECG